VYTEDGESVIQCNFRDITERRTVELALTKALAYGNDIISTLREPFLVLDGDLRVKTANRAFYDSFHVLKEQTENQFIHDLGNGQWDIPALRSLLDKVLSRNESVHDFEVEHSFPALGRKTMLLNARPFPPDSQNPELILLAVYDVSAERARAEELADLHRRKDEFLAMLSHELRNPLAPIVNAVQLLGLRKSEDELQQKACTIIERQAAQLTRLIDELMEVSRFNTGRVQLRRERILASDFVNHAIETALPLIEQHQHELTVSMAPDPIWLDADLARLEQVVVNLLTNAAKYTSDGGHIWLTVGQEGLECVVRVTGDGIDPDLLPRVFDLFTQASRTLSRSEGGLGIGLALVKRLTELHGGTVEAHSVPGEGSEFVLRLPLAAPDPSQPPPSIGEAGQPATRPLRMLVVDDNVDATETLGMLLTNSGHEVRMAHDGPAALKAALEFRPQVVLLDIGLPEMDGYQVAQQIRQQPVLTNVVLVALTGYGQDAIRQRAQAAGFDHHLVKPADFQQVQQILATVSQRTE
jgi:signal transduction histidine kinase/ActR/RegA family two-component response regulator